MRHLHSAGEFVIAGRGQVYSVFSPIESARSFAAYKAALGDFTVNGERFELIGLESFAVLRDIQIGERVGLLVKPLTAKD